MLYETVAVRGRRLTASAVLDVNSLLCWSVSQTVYFCCVVKWSVKPRLHDEASSMSWLVKLASWCKRGFSAVVS